MYKLINDKTIQRSSDHVFIPLDPANADYGAYLAWVNAGNSPTPADVVSIVVRQVGNADARNALLGSGLLTSVNNAVNQAGIEAQTYWEYSSTIEIDHPLVLAIKSQLNWSDQQLNDLFILADSFNRKS